MSVQGLSSQIADAIERGLFASSQLSDACRLLVELDSLEAALERRRLLAMATAIERIHELVVSARAAQNAETALYSPFASYCEAAGFPRALVSSVGGGAWRAESLYVAPDLEADHRGLKDYLAERVIPLGSARLEAETVRRAVPRLVKDPLFDKDTYKPLMHVSNSPGYAVAPLVARAQVVGLLHVDRFDRPVEPADLRDLVLLAEVLALAMGELTERRRLATFAGRVQALATRASALHLSRRSSWQTTAGPASHSTAGTDRPHQALSRREQQVLDLVATGLTNKEIATALAVAETAVKTHITKLLRKLGVTSRAAAVAAARSPCRSPREVS